MIELYWDLLYVIINKWNIDTKIITGYRRKRRKWSLMNSWTEFSLWKILLIDNMFAEATGRLECVSSETHHADFQPTVGSSEEERCDIISIRKLQKSLLKSGLIPTVYHTDKLIIIIRNNHLFHWLFCFIHSSNVISLTLLLVISSGVDPHLKARMVVRPSTVSEKWESNGSWVLSSSWCRSLNGHTHRSPLNNFHYLVSHPT